MYIYNIYIYHAVCNCDISINEFIHMYIPILKIHMYILIITTTIIIIILVINIMSIKITVDERARPARLRLCV